MARRTVQPALCESLLDTLAHLLPYYDIGTWTTYDLAHMTGGFTYPAVGNYQRHHIMLLDALHQISGDQRFEHYRDKWILQIVHPAIDVSTGTNTPRLRSEPSPTSVLSRRERLDHRPLALQ
jgi:hypothetical protein